MENPHFPFLDSQPGERGVLCTRFAYPAIERGYKYGLKALEVLRVDRRKQSS